MHRTSGTALRSKLFKKADAFLAAALIIAGFASLLVLRRGDGSDSITVTVSGEVYGVYSLKKDREITVATEYGTNVITVEDGKAYVSESDCAGHDCMNFAPIDGPGETIMCLPHRLIVSVGGEAEEEVDAVVF